MISLVSLNIAIIPLQWIKIEFMSIFIGANLSRQTLSNWIIGVADAVIPIYDIMKEELLKTSYIQADETTLQVIEANGKDSKSKKYMWLYKTGAAINPIILYDYQKTRFSSCPRNFLQGFSGYLQTDGYAGYNSVENIKRLYCLSHIRRKFHEIIITLNEEALKKSRAIIGIKDALPKSALGKALDYTKKLLPDMKTLLEDGMLEVDNNGSERAVKPFVTDGKI